MWWVMQFNFVHTEKHDILETVHWFLHFVYEQTPAVQKHARYLYYQMENITDFTMYIHLSIHIKNKSTICLDSTAQEEQRVGVWP